MSLSFIRGMLAAVNPCGFIMLPTYLMYFLGMQGSVPGTQRASLQRALVVSASVSAGFITVFLVAGVISQYFTSWITQNAKYATIVIGIALVALGIAMLFGRGLSVFTPHIDLGDTPRRTVGAMFVFGVAYAVASIGCTIGLFMATVFSGIERDGIVSGAGGMIAYAVGMALVVSALTVALAVANTSLLGILRGGMRHLDRIAAVFVLISGIYLIWYFYWVDLRLEGDPVTDWVNRRQNDATAFLLDHWRAAATVLAAIVIAAVVAVWLRPRRETASSTGQ